MNWYLCDTEEDSDRVWPSTEKGTEWSLQTLYITLQFYDGQGIGLVGVFLDVNPQRDLSRRYTVSTRGVVTGTLFYLSSV